MLTEKEIKEIFEECMYEKNQITSETIFAIRTIFKANNLDISLLQCYIKDNFDYILESSIDIFDVINEIIEIGDMEEFLNTYLDNHFDKLIDFVPKMIIFENVSRYMKNHKERLNDFLTKNKGDYIKYLLTSAISVIDDNELKTVNDVVVMLVDEILEHEKLDYVDIKELKEGGYSKVILIGSKVIKVGIPRETYQIPNTSVLLQPLIRVNLSDISDINGVIEVMEKVDTKSHFSNEELYQFYKKARDEGIVLADLRSDNVGFLLKDNVLHWNKELSTDMSTRGIANQNKDVLQKGDLVLLDSDYVYSESDYLEKMSRMKLKEKSDFEKRYISEQDQDMTNEVSLNKKSK